MRPARRVAGGKRDWRATTPAVGMALLVAVTALLAATLGVAATVHTLSGEPAPQVRVTAQLTADDGWPDGQVLALTHAAGDGVDVTALEIVLHLPRESDPVRVQDLPTRRLTGEHVAGPTVLDRGFAGVDGAIDAAHTDGAWTSGETAAIRVASGRYDVRPGERVRVTLVHTGRNTVLAERVVTAER